VSPANFTQSEMCKHFRNRPADLGHVEGFGDHPVSQPVLAGSRNVHLEGLSNERVGHLKEDSRTVARVDIRAGSPTVFEILQDGERIGHRGVTRPGAQVRDHANATGVVFELGVVKVLCHGVVSRGNADPLTTITKTGVSFEPYAGAVSIQQQSALVVGGGIIGLASAFRLANDGVNVTLLDPTLAQGATRAAAGMLAPSAEIAPGEEENYHYQCGAVTAWKQMSERLHAIVGRGLDIHETGTLVVGWDASDRRLVEQFADIANQFGAPCQRVGRAESPELFQGLSDRINEGFVMADDAWLDPDDAVSLLSEALQALDVLVVHERVLSVDADDDGVSARTESATYRAARGILATGWAPLPAGVRATGEHKVRPVRGVTARVQGLDRSTQPTVRAFIRGRAFYMVSRPGGYNVLGATADERSDLVVEVGELQRMLRDGLDVVPELETAAIIETRCGLRPASMDLRPFFEVLEPPGWAWSSGHYRHGVTLAPLAAIDALEFVTVGA
jgi:glycine oxidase